MIKEQSYTTDYLNSSGLKIGDRVHVLPASGRKYSFDINRTCFDFVCEGMDKRVDSFSKKQLVAMKSESIHVKLIQENIKGKNNSIQKRFKVKVLDGGAIKLNGNYVLEAFIENNDTCEIGFNTIRFESEEDIASKNQSIRPRLSERIIKSDLPILFIGETGVGKTSSAKKVHEDSLRIGNFVHINIASFASNLVESELFGHVKGAFTGALTDKVGAFKEAEGGTLFIDEIDSLSWDLQTKLLLFLDNFEARPVGSLKSYKVNTRLIFSSGRDLKLLVEKGDMRRDFYYRLSSGCTYELPTLRDDPQIIYQACEEFELNENLFIDKKLKEFYASLPWPGNFRQLIGHLKQKQVLSKSKKLYFDQTDEKLIEQSSHLIDIHNSVISLSEAKKAYAQKVFYQCHQNYSKAALLLGISSRSLKKLIEGDLMNQQ